MGSYQKEESRKKYQNTKAGRVRRRRRNVLIQKVVTIMCLVVLLIATIWFYT